jgi:hypothetical protein
MMSDQEFLIWLHERLTNIHGERDAFDYMYKLRAIIKSTDPEKITPNIATYNSIDELKQYLTDKVNDERPQAHSQS